MQMVLVVAFLLAAQVVVVLVMVAAAAAAVHIFPRFDPETSEIEYFCAMPVSFESWPLAKLEQWIGQSNGMLAVTKRIGGGHHVSGAPIKQVARST